jgi:hypothetical protein
MGKQAFLAIVLFFMFIAIVPEVAVANFSLVVKTG